MPTMIQIRNVPDDLHRVLKARAASSGLSLSDYLMREIQDVASRPTLDDMLDRLAQQPITVSDEEPADILRRHRDA